MCNTPPSVDWSKPIEYVKPYSEITWPARLVCSDRKGLNPYIVLYNSGYSGHEETIAVRVDGYRYGADHQHIRNVPKPKKKMWRAEISKTTSRVIVSRRPLIQFANGELSGWQGWTVDKLEEVEV